MKTKDLKVISFTLACWGLSFIGSGLVMNTKETTITQTRYNLSVTSNKVAESKTNEIKLKDMSLEINPPLSVDVKDYLKDIENLETSVLKSLKLDTSEVNVQEAGTYRYTITYKNKKYNGTFIITEKELPKVTLTLKNLKLEKDSILDTNLSTYIEEKIPEEIIENIVLNLSSVKTNVEGIYQYSITYNNKLYTANIEIFTPTPKAPTVITPNTPENDNTTTTPENNQNETN